MGPRAVVARVRRVVRRRAPRKVARRAPLPPPDLVPVTAPHGFAGASAPEPAPALLDDSTTSSPDLYRREEPVGHALPRRTGRAVRAAVTRSGLPHVGGSVEKPRVDIAPFCQPSRTFT